jgi:putative colanic acid biosynthesis acetyltransferase WcaF
LSKYSHSFSFKNKVGRLIWNITYWFFFRPFILNQFKGYRRFVLRLFGAEIGMNANIYSSSRIWAPWNLKIGSFSTIGPHVNVYNQGKITIGNNTVISQKSYLCASTHDFQIPNYPLIVKPIDIGDQVWVATDVFIGPGVEIGEGVVVGARAAVFGKVSPWIVVGGNPAKFIKKRELKDA